MEEQYLYQIKLNLEAISHNKEENKKKSIKYDNIYYVVINSKNLLESKNKIKELFNSIEDYTSRINN